jgi:hypothetical protein
MYDSAADTSDHICKVSNFLEEMIGELIQRQYNHDQSKLEEPEKALFDEYTPKLKCTTYGSDDYKRYLKEMQKALDHHYSCNRHHPEHFRKYVCNSCFKEYKELPANCASCHNSQFHEETDITQMNLVDLCEMVADWKAATMRHKDGDIFKSIEINQERFKYSDDLRQILINTAKRF